MWQEVGTHLKLIFIKVKEKKMMTLLLVGSSEGDGARSLVSSQVAHVLTQSPF